MAKEASINDFGLLIAYVVPGFTALWGTTFVSDLVQKWIGSVPPDAPTVGGFLYLTVAAVAVGLTVSTVRWLLVDTLHHRTGIRPPLWDFSQLRDRVGAFGVLVEIHYRYYQFHANMLIALFFVYLARRLSLGFWSSPFGWADVGFLLLAGVFFMGSRDTLRKYYTRAGQLLASQQGHAGKDLPARRCLDRLP